MVNACCPKCGITKPLCDFPRRAREGRVRTSSCKRCRADYMQGWYASNPDARRRAVAFAQKRHERNPEERFATKLRLSYGITVAEYRAMEVAQGGKCAICLNPEMTFCNRSKRTRQLAVDHCHETDVVRGLLCGDCNRALGMMKEDITALSRMISYIAKHSAPERIAA